MAERPRQARSAVCILSVWVFAQATRKQGHMDAEVFAPYGGASHHLFAPGAPGLPLYLSEPARAGAEYGMFLASAPLLATLPRGDGHPVLVLPGLLAADSSTLILRWVLRSLGYPVRGWGLGRNLGPTERVVRGLSDRLHDLTDRHGRRVTVIGWSLGGIFARNLARRHPDEVRQVVTLGSPFRLAQHDQTRAHRVFDRYSHLHVERWELPLEHGEQTIAAPRTSVYSRLDGIVSWQACLDDVTPTSENVEVYASHLGLGHHPAALWAVADRLAQPDGGWQPFRSPALLASAFPTPAGPPAEPLPSVPAPRADRPRSAS